jgi:hypothetical protein
MDVKIVDANGYHVKTVIDPTILGVRWWITYDEDGCTYLTMFGRSGVASWTKLVPADLRYRVKIDPSSRELVTTVSPAGNIVKCYSYRVDVKDHSYLSDTSEYRVVYSKERGRFEPAKPGL